MEFFVVIIILVCATFVYGSLGFGAALVAMPHLTLALGMKDATALVGFVIVTNAIFLLLKEWRSLYLREAVILLIGSMPGIIIGLFILSYVPGALLEKIFGTLFLLFGLYSLLKPTLFQTNNNLLGICMGFFSGILGGAYNTNAPPIVIYGALRRWPPEVFRATLQAYFVPSAIFIWAGHGIVGMWNYQIILYYLIFLPFGIIALLMGKYLSTYIKSAHFSQILYACVSICGLLLLI